MPATILRSFCVSIFLVTFLTLAHAQPTIDQFKEVFAKQMQALKPTGFSKRNISFINVVKGTASGERFPFSVTAYVHDYSAGYPANKYYGQTCMGKMDGWKFDMLKNEFGQWIIQGRFTVTNSTCADNPAEGVEAIPLSAVPGTLHQPGKAGAAGTANAASAKATAKMQSALYVGEYACYGTGGRLLPGMGFILKSNGNYVDLDSKRGGTFTYNSQQATITFKGGFLAGQTGKDVKQTGFQLSSTVSCEPWR
jgi:hypothetical protein